jgi:NADPH:quinone reductase-like Zn-dependent oxidoreductase
VLVKVKACSLNFRDLAIAIGTYRMAVKPDLVPLSDGAGEVVEIGPGVTRIKVGDRVAGNFHQRWIGGEAPEGAHSALGGAIDGMLAEYAVLDEDGTVTLPGHLSLEEGATLPCAGVTAWHALVDYGRLVAGQSVLVQGTGGVSIFALQFARAMGAQVIVTSSSDDKLARARSLGAAHGINYKSAPDWDKAVREFTGGRGVDLIVEVGGPGTLARSLNAVHVGGKIAMVGVLAGAAEINPMLIFRQRASVHGFSVGSVQMFEAMNRAIAVNAIRPVVDSVFAFEDVHAAYRHMQAAAHFGKIVISVA